MKTNIFHNTKSLRPILLISILLGAMETFAQNASNPTGFENNSTSSWTGGTGTESVAINSSVVRTGTYSLALTTSSGFGNRYWYSNNPYAASASGSYIHFIYWTKALAATASVDASMRYTTSAPPSGAGTAENGNAVTINNAAWTRVNHTAGNVNSRWYFPAPRKTSGTATSFYIDDIIIYYSSSSSIDLNSPNFPLNAIGTSTNGLKWTNGSDTGEGATGVQKTLIFKRTAGSVGSHDLNLANQAIYSLTSSEGPSVLGNWTLLTASVSSTASAYSSGSFSVGEEYAVVHRDLAYNYSLPSYVVIAAPAPKLMLKEASSGSSIASGAGFKMGTLYTASSTSKTFKIYNTGTGILNINSIAFTTGVKYSITSSPASSIAENDSTQFTVLFTTDATNGQYTDLLSIGSNDNSTPTFSLNLSGEKADFVLPYTYQAGINSSIYSNSELKQDFAYKTDIPTALSLGNGSAFDDLHFYADYDEYLNEGNCLPNSNSVIRIGENSKRLKLTLPSCGTISTKWCANGYRKIRITDEMGKIYEQSVNFIASNTCNNSSTIINKAGASTIYIDFLANDTNLLTSLYYLNITPYNASVQNNAKQIYEFSSGVAGEKVTVSTNTIIIDVPIGTNLTAISPSLINISPNASVSPAQGVPTDFTNPVSYVVTAQNGSSKTYTVTIKEAVNYSAAFYADSILIPIAMNEGNKTIEVIEASNASCQVPVSGNGASYTIYFLDSSDLPVGGYNIAGASNICIGTTASYSISNAPASNSPKYIWRLGGADKNLFTIIGDTISETLKIKAPDNVSSTSLDISINVEFSPSSCLLVNGSDTIPIQVSNGNPQPITSLDVDCAVSDFLTISAMGSADATAYNWSFSPSQQIVTQSGNSIVIKLNNNNDIAAYVNTQSACGVSINNTPYSVDYATPSSTWTGLLDDDWSKNANWTGRVPKSCTDIIIPDVSTGISYPTILANGACRSITFKAGGAVLGLQKLSYNQAFVEMNLQRSKWYTLTPPLKNMYSGDYYTTGKPKTQAKLFDDVNPDIIGDTVAVGTWTRSFANLAVPFSAGMGFAFQADSISYNYPSGISTSHTDLSLKFPARDANGALVKTLYPYSGVTGKVYTNMPTPLAKDSALAYRFAVENSLNQLEDVHLPIKAGLNLVGNPLMTHLDFNKLYLDNSSKISNNVKFWNGSTFVTFMAGDDISSSLDLANNKIPPMQAFFVYGLTSSGTLDFDLDQHFVADTDSKLRAAKTGARKNTMHIKAVQNKLVGWTAIALKQGASNEYSKDDAFKLFSNNRNAPDVYTVAQSNALDINQFGKLPYITPLSVKTNAKGSLELNFIGTESFDGIDVYLINTLTGERQNLKEDNKLALNNKDAYNDGSLFLEFRSASSTTGIAEKQSETEIRVYCKNEMLHAESNAADRIKKITLWDELGKLIYQNSNLDTQSFEMSLNIKNTIGLCLVETEHNASVVKVLIK